MSFSVLTTQQSYFPILIPARLYMVVQGYYPPNGVTAVPSAVDGQPTIYYTGPINARKPEIGLYA